MMIGIALTFCSKSRKNHVVGKNKKIKQLFFSSDMSIILLFSYSFNHSHVHEKLNSQRLCSFARNRLCNFNYTLFTKLPWPGESEGTFQSSSKAATCPPVYHTRWRLHTVPLIAERQARLP